MSARTRVLVVEDSVTVRKRLVEALAQDPEIEVVGEAANGREGIALCESLRPDVVTMDVVMPDVDGLAATEHIMGYCPTPILIVSGSRNRGEAFRTFDALAAGAAEVMDKPPDGDLEAWEARLRGTVKLLSRVAVIAHPRARLSAARARAEDERAAARPARAAAPDRVLAIGGSTGAPAALARILDALPADLGAPVLTVVHIAPAFAPSLTEWLATVSRLPARFAVDGEPLPYGPGAAVLLPPPDRHLLVEGGRVRLSAAAERHACRPSVDLLFESLAAHAGSASVGCLLSGMGVDGAAGLLAIRRAGGRTLAQSEASSVVFGMPGEAVRIGAAERILDVAEIGPALVELAGRGACS